jgi:hypothetical protein
MFLTEKAYLKSYPNDIGNYVHRLCDAPSDWYLKSGMLKWGNDPSCLAGPFKGEFAHVHIADERHNPFLKGKYRLLPYAEQYEVCLAYTKKAKKRHPEYYKKESIEKTAERETEEHPTTEKYIRLYICGNDDTSWTKYFSSKREAFELLELFSECPPTYDDVLKFGFFFSN